jgi:hypothetical protein
MPTEKNKKLLIEFKCGKKLTVGALAGACLTTTRKLS